MVKNNDTRTFEILLAVIVIAVLAYLTITFTVSAWFKAQPIIFEVEGNVVGDYNIKVSENITIKVTDIQGKIKVQMPVGMAEAIGQQLVKSVE